MLKKIKDYTKKEPLFVFLFLLVILVALFFRTFKYSDRIYMQADNSRDVQVATYARDSGKIPQIGQFSSAGPFFYGPWYYVFLETVGFLPFGLLTHWYFSAFLSMLFVFLIFYLGFLIEGRWTGLIAALYTAISRPNINNSFGTWNPSVIPILVLLALIIFVRWFGTGKRLYIFLLALVLGLAVTIHLQSVLVTPLIVVALFKQMSFKKIVNNFSLAALGFVLPFLPLIYFDANHNWYDFISFFIFFFVDQYKIWVPNRWITYVFEYWPTTWGSIIGGNSYLGFLIIGLLGLVTVLRVRNFAKYKYFYLILLGFFLQVILFRYYRGERFVYYSFFAFPSVLVLTAFAVVQVYKFKKILGIIVFLVIYAFTVKDALGDIESRSLSYPYLLKMKNEIYSTFPGQKFDIYGCVFNSEYASHPMALLMYFDGRNSSEGVKIGLCPGDSNELSWVYLTELKTNTKGEPLWFNRSTDVVYKDTVEWFLDKPPGKGDFWQYIKDHFNPKCYPHC